MSEVECADGGWADVGDMPGVTSADAASACWASRLYLVAARCLFLRCVSSSCSESAIRLRLYFWCSLLKFQCGASRAFWLIVFQSLRNARSCVPSCRDHHFSKRSIKSYLYGFRRNVCRRYCLSSRDPDLGSVTALCLDLKLARTLKVLLCGGGG